jgi:hypothetical protein
MNRARCSAIIEVADIMHCEDDKPVTYVESSKIERAYYALVGASPAIKDALTLCRFGQKAAPRVAGDANE